MCPAYQPLLSCSLLSPLVRVQPASGMGLPLLLVHILIPKWWVREGRYEGAPHRPGLRKKKRLEDVGRRRSWRHSFPCFFFLPFIYLPIKAPRRPVRESGMCRDAATGHQNQVGTLSARGVVFVCVNKRTHKRAHVNLGKQCRSRPTGLEAVRFLQCW